MARKKNKQSFFSVKGLEHVGTVWNGLSPRGRSSVAACLRPPNGQHGVTLFTGTSQCGHQKIVNALTAPNLQLATSNLQPALSKIGPQFVTSPAISLVLHYFYFYKLQVARCWLKLEIYSVPSVTLWQKEFAFIRAIRVNSSRNFQPLTLPHDGRDAVTLLRCAFALITLILQMTTRVVVKITRLWPGNALKEENAAT